MKIQILILVLALPILAHAQKTLSMDDVEGRQELSMGEVTGKSSDGIYRYYAKGEKEPFTGILYAKYDNGNISSWQEYEDGIGQGKWINYYENGNYKEIGHYEQNRVEGGIKKFHSNGKLKAEGTYKDWRIKVGKWTYYDDNGQFVRSEDYGKKGSIEEVQEYYDRGDISYSWYADILSKNGF